MVSRLIYQDVALRLICQILVRGILSMYHLSISLYHLYVPQCLVNLLHIPLAQSMFDRHTVVMLYKAYHEADIATAVNCSGCVLRR